MNEQFRLSDAERHLLILDALAWQDAEMEAGRLDTAWAEGTAVKHRQTLTHSSAGSVRTCRSLPWTPRRATPSCVHPSTTDSAT
ncbi:hypothetical protein Lfu02_77760 [Longispora fulva]|uniref:Uncharacterized protein n=1 Tax=Longispora fulva TaxID=619741 RepID=A0A8J7GE71_9ACTN|nr:hypothetical protein [Longispora fulva]GIG63404.1 hypothetical protein Lfu02_77760 [Longispora fulva]